MNFYATESETTTIFTSVTNYKGESSRNIICRWDVKYVTIHNVQFNGSIFLRWNHNRAYRTLVFDGWPGVGLQWKQEGETGKLNVFFKPTL